MVTAAVDCRQRVFSTHDVLINDPSLGRDVYLIGRTPLVIASFEMSYPQRRNYRICISQGSSERGDKIARLNSKKVNLTCSMPATRHV